MKVVCINNIGQPYLTINKAYEIVTINGLYYKIISVNGYKHWYPKEYFKPLSEIRNDKIDKLLE
jgi:hypothetical protein